MTKENSLFTKVTFAQAIDPKSGGQYGILIKCNPSGNKENHNMTKVYGILNDSIAWNVTATWDNIGLDSIITSVVGSNPILEAANGIVNFANQLGGRSFENTGLFTRLFYKNSGYLEIMPKLRVFDFENKGLPLQAAMIFSSLCIPKQADKMFDLSISKETIDNLGITAGGTTRDVLKPVMGEENATTAGYAVNKLVTGALDGINNTTINWSNSPDTVDVEIGNWLKLTDMVLINVTTNFSYEMTDNGPMYVDFTLTLKSREALMLTDNGELSQVKIRGSGMDASRVSFNSTEGFVDNGTFEDFNNTMNLGSTKTVSKNDSNSKTAKAPVSASATVSNKQLSKRLPVLSTGTVDSTNPRLYPRKVTGLTSGQQLRSRK